MFNLKTAVGPAGAVGDTYKRSTAVFRFNAVQPHPTKSGALMREAPEFLKAGNPEQALRNDQGVRSLAAGRDEVLWHDAACGTAEALAGMAHYKQAARLYQNLLENAPSDSHPLLAAAHFHLMKKQYEQVMKPAYRGLAIQPAPMRHTRDFHRVLCIIFRHSGDCENLALHSESILRLEPDNQHALWNKSVALGVLRRFQESIAPSRGCASPTRKFRLSRQPLNLKTADDRLSVSSTK